MLTHGTEESPGNYDNYTYTIDIDQFTDPDEIITITGDWGRSDNPALDGDQTTNGGEYVAAQIPNPSGGIYFGDLSVNLQNGNMTWAFTVAELQQFAGQNYDVYFVGKYAGQNSDSDLLKLVITCFLDGTMIATPTGETAVESLAIGDLVKTADGRSVPVTWVGRKRITNHVLLSDKAAPVRVSAGALGRGLPHSDLLLSADHGLIVDGMVVNAGAMVNGGSIHFVDLAQMPEEFTYYHIETESHDEILANGLCAETFVDYIGRKGFDNYDEYLSLYGCDRIIPEMKRLRISSRRQLPDGLREQLNIPAFSEGVEALIEQFGQAA
ncbi:Hint domain-containing protein [Paracoccus sp. TOH]|uniref:Hint domain-containing protein n=1 Tax=Paracoccus sp. TOH TaxID=1263728 RepID=UPI0025AEFBC6|nr:Hint domain-containing protein [Paracoccus sp. TOH]WJS85372.1 Hint domain-containing protein [Paracoccus sp. TOH]